MKSCAILLLTIFLIMPSAYAAEETSQSVKTEGGKSQNASTEIILGVVTADGSTAGSSEPSTYCSVYSGKTLAEGTVVLISGTRICESRYPTETIPFYELSISGKTYFIQQSKVKLSDSDKARLDGMPTDSMQEYKEKAKVFSLYIRQQKLNAALKAIKKTSKHGLTLLKHRIYDTSEYTEGTGFSVSIANPTKKTIKYVSFTVIGYNSVKDPVSGGKKRGTSLTVKGVGPIEPDSSASYDWEYMWFTDLVQTHKVTSIMVEYMDGSKRTIKNMKDIKLATEHYLTMVDND